MDTVEVAEAEAEAGAGAVGEVEAEEVDVMEAEVLAEALTEIVLMILDQPFKASTGLDYSWSHFRKTSIILARM